MGRLTQEMIEVALTPPPEFRLTQEMIEVALTPPPEFRLSQMVIEVALKFQSNQEYGMWPQEQLRNPHVQGWLLKPRRGQM